MKQETNKQKNLIFHNKYMNEDIKLKKIYEGAYNFLISKIDEKILKKELNHYKHCKPKLLKDVFKQMVGSLKNKQGHVNFIADVSDMRKILLDFNAKKICNKFGNNWQKLFLEFQKKFGKKYKMDIDNKKNAWVMYSKGVLSCANFLTKFQSLKEFDRFVKHFLHDKNELIIASLPMLLEREIFGFGFPLACDFLKELGYGQYGKPDVHLKEIFLALDLIESDNDYEVFKIIVKMGLLVKESPVKVDKIFWLIGAGKFNENNIKIGRQKEEFIAYIKNKL